MSYSKRAQDLARQLPTPEVKRPGMMLYFEEWKRIREKLNPDQIAELLSVVMFYGETGLDVSCNDMFVEFAFDLLKQKIDYDRDGYITGVWQRKYAAATREMDKRDRPSFEDWLEDEVMRYQARERIRASVRDRDNGS